MGGGISPVFISCGPLGKVGPTSNIKDVIFRPSDERTFYAHMPV